MNAQVLLEKAQNEFTDAIKTEEEIKSKEL